MNTIYDDHKKPQVVAICINFAAKYLEPRRKFDLLINIALASLVALALLKLIMSH